MAYRSKLSNSKAVNTLLKKMRRNKRRKPRIYTGSKLIDKTYSFSYRLNDQYITNDPANAGHILFTGNVNGPINALNTLPTPPGPMSSAQSGVADLYDFGMGFFFNASQLQNFTAAAAMFDQYKISSIVLTLEYLGNTVAINGAGVLPTIYSIVDNDNAAIPTSQTFVTSKQGYKMMCVGDKNKTKFSIKIVPKQGMIVSNGTRGAPSQTGQAMTNSWCDSAFNDIKHFGLKLWFKDVLLGTTTNTVIRFGWTYNMRYRGAQSLY